MQFVYYFRIHTAYLFNNSPNPLLPLLWHLDELGGVSGGNPSSLWKVYCENSFSFHKGEQQAFIVPVK